MDYATIAKDTFSHLYKSYNSLKQSELDPTVRVLIELRTSQINGCPYCCQLHRQEAQKLGIKKSQLDQLPLWAIAQPGVFNEAEKLALQWCEDITALSAHRDQTREQLLLHFSERAVVDLTTLISIMNALNRIAISLKDA